MVKGGQTSSRIFVLTKVVPQSSTQKSALACPFNALLLPLPNTSFLSFFVGRNDNQKDSVRESF
jgi:hypothetical protein